MRYPVHCSTYHGPNDKLYPLPTWIRIFQRIVQRIAVTVEVLGVTGGLDPDIATLIGTGAIVGGEEAVGTGINTVKHVSKNDFQKG